MSFVDDNEDDEDEDEPGRTAALALAVTTGFPTGSSSIVPGALDGNN